MLRDPVCGMEVAESAAIFSLIYKGERYFFCSEGCWSEFKRRPPEYLKAEASYGRKPSEEKTNV